MKPLALLLGVLATLCSVLPFSIAFSCFVGGFADVSAAETHAWGLNALGVGCLILFPGMSFFRYGLRRPNTAMSKDRFTDRLTD